MQDVSSPLAQFLAALLQLWPLWLVLLAAFAIRIALYLRRYRRLLRSGIAEIDRMTGAVFEQYLALLFRQHGYRVEHTGRAGDYGADLVISKGGVRTIVQAKRYRRNVNLKAVQEAVAAKAMYGCTHAMVVTNSGFARSAHTLARANGVELWDRDKLISMILTGRRNVQKGLVVLDEPAVAPDPERVPG